MSYSDALNKILSLQSLGIKPGLARIYALLEKLGNPQNKIKVIHIAGTNGKGTVAAAISNALQKSGYKVGLFTSPWITDYREQIQINGEFISETDFQTEFNKLSGDGTEFESLTAIMYDYFCCQNVDYAVVECGMGGKGDCTNVLEKPELCVLTSIALDHQKFLGDTVEQIAKEKAGIIKHNSNVVLYPNSCKSVVESYCREMGANLFCVPEYNDVFDNDLATAKLALSVLGISYEVYSPSLPARQEIIGKYLIDGAHNVDGANALKDFLETHKKETIAVIGMMKDKNYNDYLKIIAPYCKKIIATTTSNSRSLLANELADSAKKYCSDVVSINNPHEALKIAQKESTERIMICGSFYLARDVRKDII